MNLDVDIDNTNSEKLLTMSLKFRDLFNKLTSVFLCVCPLIHDKLRHNIVKVAVEPLATGE